MSSFFDIPWWLEIADVTRAADGGPMTSRINRTHSGVPRVIWVALLLGAAIVIGFEYLFGLPNFRVQLDFPFRGDVSIASERWAALHEQIGVGH
jgi:hypothetical protein